MPSTSLAGTALPKKVGALVVVLPVLLGILLLTFKPALPLFILGGAGLLAVVATVFFLAYPKWGLMAGVFYIYTGLTYYFQVHAAYPIIVLVTVAVALRLLRGEDFEMRSPGFNWATALFIVFAIQSLFVSYDLEYSFLVFLQLLKTLILVYLVVQLIRTPDDLHKYVLLIFLANIAAVVMGLINLQVGLTEGQASVGFGAFARFESNLGDPNEFALYLISALPLGIYVLRRSRRWFTRGLVALGIVVLVVAVFATFSRAAVFSLSFVVLAVIARDVRNRAAVAVALLAITIPLLLTPSLYWDRLANVGEVLSRENLDWSLYLRFRAVETAWKYFLANPLTGVGLGNFVVHSGTEIYQHVVAHNAYLEVLVSVGIVGFLAFMAMYGSAFGHFLRAMRARWSSEHRWMRHLAFYLMLSLAATLIGSLFLSIQFDYVTWLPAAGGLAAGRMAVGLARTPRIGET